MHPAQSFHNKTRKYVKVLQKFADRIWYPPFIGLLAAIDNVVLFIPSDGILVSSSMLTPKRWFALALNVTIGSTIGAIALAHFVEAKGLEWVLTTYPGINETKTWTLTKYFFEKHGILFVFAVAISPIIQMPAVILAGLAETPLLLLGGVIFVGRFCKYLVMSYVGTHAPKLLNKMWGIQSELNDTGVKPPP